MSAFVLIGERINTQRDQLHSAVLARDEEFLRREARRQVKAGATHLDVYAGRDAANETAELTWILATILPELPEHVGVVVDSGRRECLEAALDVLRGRSGTILNSCSAAKDQQIEASRNCIELAAVRGAAAMVLLAPADSPGGMMARAEELVNAMDAAELPMERRFLDPQILPAAFDAVRPRKTLEVVSELKARWPHTRVAAGVSNVSYNLPARGVLNAQFLTMLLASGLDAAVCDPCNKHVRQALAASRALLGADDFFADYLESAGGW